MKNLLRDIWDFIKSLFGQKKKSPIEYDHSPKSNLEEWCSIEKKVFELINEYRLEEGLQELRSDKDIQWQAKLRTHELEKESIETGTISHQGYSSAYVNLRNLGYKRTTEILGYAYSTPQSVISAWKRSQKGHDKALLGNFRYVGVAYLEGKSGKKHYCTIFCS